VRSPDPSCASPGTPWPESVLAHSTTGSARGNGDAAQAGGRVPRAMSNKKTIELCPALGPAPQPSRRRCHGRSARCARVPCRRVRTQKRA
jgi:hypothetical protein